MRDALRPTVELYLQRIERDETVLDSRLYPLARDVRTPPRHASVARATCRP